MEEIELLYPLQERHNRQERQLGRLKQKGPCLSIDIDYKGHTLCWIEYGEYEASGTPQKGLSILPTSGLMPAVYDTLAGTAG